MAKQVTIRRGTTAEHADFAGAEGEITVDTTKDTVVVHDGVTDGGFPLALESAALSDAEIKTAYENNANTNAFTNADESKLDGIETSADVTDDANVRAALAAATADVSVNSHKITSVTDPTADQDAATKAYVDSVANGLETKDSVLVATTGANITLSGLQTIDGVSLVANDRVLVKEQTNATENGIYDVKSGGWLRSTDADNTPGGELGPGTFTFVESGSTLADNGYVATGIATGTGALTGYFDLGTDNIVFSQFSGAGQITAGTNLNKSGNTINLDTVLTNFASTGIDDNATSTAITINSSENIGIGIASPDGRLHVHSGSAGAVTASSISDDLVIENSTNGGLSILTPNNVNARINFGDPENNRAGEIVYDHTNTAMTFLVEETMVLRLEDDGRVGIGIIPPDGTLHVHTGSAGAVTAIATADDLVVENSSHVGISLLSPDIDSSRIVFGTLGDSEGANIIWNNSLTFMIIGTKTTGGRVSIAVDNGVEAVRITSAGDVGIGIAAPDGTLHVHTASAGVVTASASADEIVVENSGAVGMSFLSTNGSAASIFFADPEDNNVGFIEYDHNTDRLRFGTNGAERLRFDNAGGVFINDSTGNANMTIGLTINQGANDNQIFCGKSSDVATGLTTATQGNDVETDDFFVIEKIVGTVGGVRFKSLIEDSVASSSLVFEAYGGTAPTGKTNASAALVQFSVAEHNGSNVLTDITANGNIFAVRRQIGGNDRMAFMVDEDGDLFVDGASSLTVFDEYDDAELIRTFEVTRTPDNIIRSKWDDYVRYNEQTLVDCGILGDTLENGGMVNITQLQRLHSGAIWQMHTKQKEMEVELNETRDLLTQTTMVLDQAMKQLALLEGPK